ncbi:MBL fold metallo-hydrolase [Oceanivirga miroungae]|uniref:Beta-lactamase n=1 Tax=Oceanivirga miroungae TaxID=1130046 RepID=A0A6I8MDZ5_9FUSO|nr:MBL fold metallo-hydrolase [Oceanivirga miroungae]VWL85414.1 beta-lactamase [Oceanivirga miroungae]
MKISVLGSGSKGNSSFIEIGDKKFLVDVGFSMKKIEEKLNMINQSFSDIDGIFITHDHGDHIRSFGAISRKYDIPLYIHKKSLKEVSHKMGKLNQDKIVLLEEKKILIDNIMVENFDVMHDSANNLGYSFSYRNEKLSYVTDIGRITNIVKMNCMNSDILAFETNYDLDLLLEGEYPWTLKNRVKGNYGHISNEEAAKMFSDVQENRLKKIIMLHLSDENNDESLAYETVRKYVKNDIDIEASKQDEPTKIYMLEK